MIQVLAELADTISYDRAMAGVDRLGPQSQHALQRRQVLRQSAWLVVNHDRASAKHQVASEERALGGIPEAQALTRVARGFESAQRSEAHLVLANRALDAGQIGVAGQPSAGALAQGQRRGQMIAVAVSDQHGGDRPEVLGSVKDGGQVTRLVGPRIDDGQIARAIGDEIGVRAGEGHRARVRREHALDQHAGTAYRGRFTDGMGLTRSGGEVR